MKKRFIDYSINKKMNLTLLWLVVFPVLILGCLLIVWLYKNNTAQLRTETFRNLDQGLEKVGEYRRSVREISVECMGNMSLQRIGIDHAIGRDYLELRDWLDTQFEKAGVYDNICINMKNGKQYQAGKYIIEDMETVYGRLKDRSYCWLVEDSPEYYFVDEKAWPEKVWTFYSLIESYETAVREEYVGTLSIRIREDELCKLYDFAFDQRFEEVSLIMEDGEIISSTGKDSVGQIYDLEKVKGKTGGSFWQDGKIHIFTYAEDGQYLLMASMPLLIFYGNVLLLICVIAVAFVLCMIFAMIFGRLQRIYIIRPIYDLVGALNEMEGNRFVQIRQQNRSDEVGVLQSAFNEMNVRLDHLINHVYRVDYEKKEAELKALTEQLNPHFLYNILDSIRWKALRNKDGEVAEQIVILSDFYRYILNNGNEFLTIGEDISFLKQYLYLMDMRFGSRVQWEIDVDESLMEMKIPKLILQPLVENAVVHGLEPREEGGRVRITIKDEKIKISALVQDNGIGFPQDLMCCNEEVLALEGSFALKNIYNRMKLYYGEDFLFRIESRRDEGTRIEISIIQEGKHETFDCRR